MRKRNVFALLLTAVMLMTACVPAMPEESTAQTQPFTEPEPELSLVVLQINGGCYPLWEETTPMITNTGRNTPSASETARKHPGQ